MNVLPFKPGFRISVTDTFVLAAGSVGAGLVAQSEWWMGLIIGFVVGHFFLFCNVVRVARPLELAWAALFTALAGSTIVVGRPGWPVTFATSLVGTLLVIALQIRKPSYHGIAWQWINPELHEWWDAQAGGTGGEEQ